MNNKQEVNFSKRTILSSRQIYLLITAILAMWTFGIWTTSFTNNPVNQEYNYVPITLVLSPIAIYVKKYGKIRNNWLFLLRIFKIILISSLVLYLSKTLFVYYTQNNIPDVLPQITQWIRRLI